jgi:hypothetical protein
MQSMKLTLFLDVSVGLKRNHMRHFEGTHLVLMSFIVIPIYGTVGDLTGLDGSWSARREKTYGLHHPSLSQSFLTGWSFSIYCRLIRGHFQVVDWLALGRRPLHLIFQDLMLLWRIARGVGEPRGTGRQPDSIARHHGSYQGWFTFPIDPIWIHVTCWGGWQPLASHPFRAMSSSTQHKGRDIIRPDQRTSKANSFPMTYQTSILSWSSCPWTEHSATVLFGAFSKVFMLANHALTRRYMRPRQGEVSGGILLLPWPKLGKSRTL